MFYLLSLFFAGKVGFCSKVSAGDLAFAAASRVAHSPKMSAQVSTRQRAPLCGRSCGRKKEVHDAVDEKKKILDLVPARSSFSTSSVTIFYGAVTALREWNFTSSATYAGPAAF